MEKISQYVADATSNPITGFDYLDFSNSPDGGLTYDVSKKILVSEFLNYLNTSIVNLYNSDGTLLGPRTINGDSFSTTLIEGSFIVQPIDRINDYGIFVADELGAPKGVLFYDNLSLSASMQLDDIIGQYFYAGDGRVSIGGITPTARLHIRGDGAHDNFIVENIVKYKSMVIFEDGSIGMGTDTITGSSQLQVSTTGTRGVRINNAIYNLDLLPSGTSTLTEINTSNIGFQLGSTDGYYRLNRTTGAGYALIYLNGTATGLALSGATSGAPHLIISSIGGINFSSLPISPVGLVAGDLWNNLGVLNII
jgi:hypothetical protein